MKYSEIIDRMFGSKWSKWLRLHDGTVMSTLFIKNRVSIDEIEIPSCAISSLQNSKMSKQCKKQIINHEIDYLITPVYVNSTRAYDTYFTGTAIFSTACWNFKHKMPIGDYIGDTKRYVIGPHLIIDKKKNKVLFYTSTVIFNNPRDVDFKYLDLKYRNIYFNYEVFKSDDAVCKYLKSVANGLLARTDKYDSQRINVIIQEDDQMSNIIWSARVNQEIDLTQCRIPENE